MIITATSKENINLQFFKGELKRWLHARIKVSKSNVDFLSYCMSFLLTPIDCAQSVLLYNEVIGATELIPYMREFVISVISKTAWKNTFLKMTPL